VKTDPQEIKPICYMVMPFRKKKVEDPRPGFPTEIDFDALWERAYWPAIEALGYMPMRADFDPRSAIVKAMLERIAFADLVLADITLGNGNVYYEVGIRHVAKKTGCVLIAADWAKPLFDISQFASIRFPLTNGDVPPDEAKVIRDLIFDSVPNIKNSWTPYYELTQQSQDTAARRSTFRDFAASLSAFQAKVKAVRMEFDAARRAQRLAQLRAGLTPAALEIPEVAIELLEVIRDSSGRTDWAAVRAFIESLPKAARDLAFIREQYCLAVAECGEPLDAIGLLEALITEQGDTPERSGLMGGRYKRLWKAAQKARKEAKESEPSRAETEYLDRAIERYTRGMELDYNAYYCSSNLPLLLRARGGEGDERRAAVIDTFVLAACERALKRNESDEWLRPTLLGAAFRAGDVKSAAEHAKTVKREGAAQWKLETTLQDIAGILSLMPDSDIKLQLQSTCDELEHFFKVTVE
jgi:hypothetical protein